MTSLTVDDAGCVAAITKRIVNVSTAWVRADEVWKIQNTCVLFSIVVHCSLVLRQCHAVVISKKAKKKKQNTTVTCKLGRVRIHRLREEGGGQPGAVAPSLGI